jgi:hypothetical protein
MAQGKPEITDDLLGYLRDRFPDMFAKAELPDHGVRCSAGWLDLIVETLERLKEQSEKECVPIPQIRAIKEKFGALRISAQPLTDQMDSILVEAMSKSQAICENCGAPGKALVTGTGYKLTLCNRCKNLVDAEEVEKGYPDE